MSDLIFKRPTEELTLHVSHADETTDYSDMPLKMVLTFSVWDLSCAILLLVIKKKIHTRAQGRPETNN